MRSQRGSKSERASGGPPFPLVAKVDDLRKQADVPVGILVDVLGMTRLAYYLWTSGKVAKPNIWRQRMLLGLGKALLLGLKSQELPIVRSKLLTPGERKIKVRTTLKYLLDSVK